MTDPAEWQRLVGARMRARRDLLGYSLNDVATRAGFSQTLLRQMENGIGASGPVNPKRSTRIAWCRALNYLDDCVEVLLSGGDPVEVEPPVAPTLESLSEQIDGLRSQLSTMHRDLAETRRVMTELMHEIAEMAKVATDVVKRLPRQPPSRQGNPRKRASNH